MMMNLKVRMILTTDGNTLTKKARGARRRAREFALQGIYSWLMQKTNHPDDVGLIDAHIREEPGFQEADFDWYHTLFYGVVRDLSSLQERFSRFIDRPIDKLSPVERAALLLGTY